MSKFNIINIQELAQAMLQKPELLQKGINAKTIIQRKLLESATIPEAIALSQNTIAPTLKIKLFAIGKDYAIKQFSCNDNELYGIAMALGIIMKELDNGNTEYVTNEGILNIINKLI